MELKKIIIVGCFLLGLLACKKPFERTCLKSKGDETSTIVKFDKTIDSLVLYDNIYYRLSQNPNRAGEIEISGGKNLIPFVDIEEKNNGLIIHNNNKCKFLRSYQNKIYVTLFVDTITYIYFEGTEELKCLNTLHSNELRLTMKEGNGTAYMDVNNWYTSISITNGVGNFYLKGQAVQAYIYCRSNSFGDATKFTTSQKLMVNSTTAGNIQINADNTQLEATINRNGNIQYYGTPTKIVLQQKGTGNLVKKH